MASEPGAAISIGQFPLDTSSSSASQAYRAIHVETHDRGHPVCSGKAGASAGVGSPCDPSDNSAPWTTAKSDECLADAASHEAEAKRCSEVHRIMLRVAYKLERDGPRPGKSDKRETTHIEYSLRHSILVLDQGVRIRIVCAPRAIRGVKKGKK